MRNVLTSLLILCVLAGCRHANPAPAAAAEPPTVERQLLTSLNRAPSVPELITKQQKDLLALPQSTTILEWARRGVEDAKAGLPVTTYSQYREFRKSGSRPPYEKPYFAKRTMLTQAVMAAWLDQDDSALPVVSDLVWNICDEATWVVPAHERDSDAFIDLFASETAADLAYTITLLGERLPSEVRKRALLEIETRVMQPYEKAGKEYSWGGGRNNWTGVCAGSIGETFLLLEQDANRLAPVLATVVEQLRRYIEIGFSPDGGCLEGIGYWNYGLSHLVAFSEMLRQRTDGAVDLLADPKMAKIAGYPGSAVIGPNKYASFADAHEDSSIHPYLAARLAERTGHNELKALVSDGTESRLSCCMRNILWWNGVREPMPELTDVFLPDSGIGRLVSSFDGIPVVLTIKAGHNAEPHNNNDVGSFILRIGETTFLCDPGGGLYNKAYFSKDRYKNVFANSYGHSVPRIAGQLQKEGKEYAGTLEQAGDKALRVRFERAYGVAELKKAERNVTLEADGTVTMDAAYEFEGDNGRAVEEAFITWRPVMVHEGIARISGTDGILDIRVNEGIFETERLEEACRANHKKETLTRITVHYPTAQKTAARYTFVWHPAGVPAR
jgi:hypothetical protein